MFYFVNHSFIKKSKNVTFLVSTLLENFDIESYVLNVFHRWKLCQCDRHFALQLRAHENEYNNYYSEVINHLL